MSDLMQPTPGLPTLSERLAEYKQYLLEREEKRIRHLCDCEEWMDVLDALNISVHEGKGDAFRSNLRQSIREGNVAKLGILCDHCRSELVDASPRHGGLRTLTASIPPKMHVGCPGCGFHTSVEVAALGGRSWSMGTKATKDD